MDLRMPGIGGLEATRQLRASGSKVDHHGGDGLEPDRVPRLNRTRSRCGCLCPQALPGGRPAGSHQRSSSASIMFASCPAVHSWLLFPASPGLQIYQQLAKRLRMLPQDLLTGSCAMRRLAGAQRASIRWQGRWPDTPAQPPPSKSTSLARDFRYDTLVTRRFSLQEEP